jgi:hypothetical protein
VKSLDSMIIKGCFAELEPCHWLHCCAVFRLMKHDPLIVSVLILVLNLEANIFSNFTHLLSRFAVIKRFFDLV